MCSPSEKNKLIFLKNILYDYLSYVIGSKDFQHGVDADHEAEYFRGMSVCLSLNNPPLQSERWVIRMAFVRLSVCLSVSQSVCPSVTLLCLLHIS